MIRFLQIRGGSRKGVPTAPSSPTGTDLTFSNGLNSWTDVSVAPDKIYQTTSSTSTQADQSIPASADGGAMMQFTGSEENPYLVLNTTSSVVFGSQYDAPAWFINISKSGTTYYLWTGYGNDWTSAGSPNGTNTLAVGDWVRIWRDSTTGKIYAQKWVSGAWTTLYDLTAAAAIVSATVPTTTAQLYISMSTYTSVTTKCTNPKKVP